MNKIELSLPDHGALRIPLYAQQVLSIAKPGGGSWNDMTIEGRLGEIWVTMGGDSRDHVISPGDRLDLRGRGPVVAQAVSDSELRIFSTPNIKQPNAAFKAMLPNGYRNFKRYFQES